MSAFHVKPYQDGCFTVPRETTERLQAFMDLLFKWNSRLNLVSARSADDIWRRHVEDSLQLLPLIPEGVNSFIDLGSGAGFPGVIVAMASGHGADLVESDKRKAAFLTEAAARLALSNVRVYAKRIEDVALPKAKLLTARALAPLPTLLRYAHRLLAPDGAALFPKGRTVEEELTAASRDWMMRVERFPSRTDPDSTILRLSEIRPAGSEA